MEWGGGREEGGEIKDGEGRYVFPFREDFNEEHIISGNVRDKQVRQS